MSKHLIATLLLVAASIFLFTSGYWKHRLRIETLKDKNLITVTISDIDCDRMNGNSSLIFKHRGNIHVVNLTHGRCVHYKIGEQIKLYYNPESNWYLLGDDGKEEEEVWGMIGGGVMFIIVSISLFRIIYLRKLTLSAKKKTNNEKY